MKSASLWNCRVSICEEEVSRRHEICLKPVSNKTSTYPFCLSKMRQKQNVLKGHLKIIGRSYYLCTNKNHHWSEAIVLLLRCGMSPLQKKKFMTLSFTWDRIKWTAWSISSQMSTSKVWYIFESYLEMQQLW